MRALVLRRARPVDERGALSEPRDVGVRNGAVCEPAELPPGAAMLDLDGRALLPALVNAHDVLDQASLPPLGRPPHASVYDWLRACDEDAARVAPAVAVPLADRLFLGGMRNLLAATASVLHHNADHRSLAREDFPVRVQRRYGFAHSAGRTPALRRAYRTSDRRIPWLVRAAEGSDPQLRGELDALKAANVLRQNTVIAHGTALAPDDAARLREARASLAWCPESDARLYARVAPALSLLEAGVGVGLGTDGAATGARDMLTALVSAQAAGASPAQALFLATRGAAAVARMPLGGEGAGSPADLVAVDSLDRLLAGDRGSVALLLVRGEPACGDPALLAASGAPAAAITLDGRARALAAPLAARLAGILRRHPSARGALWLAGVALG